MTTKFEVNGKPVSVNVEPRLTLADCLRHELRLTGTHVGCEHGVCGACTVLVDGEAVRSCLILAVQAEGTKITTVEEHRAGAADAVLAAEVRPGETAPLPKEVGQGQAGLDRRGSSEAIIIFVA